MCVCVYVYIYIYIERERDRETDRLYLLFVFILLPFLIALIIRNMFSSTLDFVGIYYHFYYYVH